MLAIDASVLALALLDDADVGEAARTRVKPERLVAPELIDLEVMSVVRRKLAIGSLDRRRAQQALDDLLSMAILRAPHRPLLRRCWELRANITPYDAAYVAVAEAMGCELLTADRRLASAPGPRCRIEVFGAA